MMAVVVDTLVDVSDANDGVTSLREAIAAAPLNGSVVEFHSSLTQGVITLDSQLTITQSMAINGLGASQLTVSAGGNHRVFQIYPGIAATISGLKITGGKLLGAADEGAGIFNSGTLTLNGVEVSGNLTAGVGGGISSRNYWGDGSNSLIINDSTISDNHAVEGSGIAAFPAGGAFQIRRSTISNNATQLPLDLQQWSSGGGIQLVGAVSSPLIENSTISGNVATYVGGIRLWGVASPLTVVNSTIAFNRGLTGGAGIDVPANSTPPKIQSSIVAQNTNGTVVPVHLDVSGAFSSESSYSLFGTGVGVAGTGIKNGTASSPLDPKLSPLANYGGPNKTHVPLPGSPAIDAGGPTGSAPATDQRGWGRLIERAEPNATSARDMGAAELSAPLGAAGDFNGDGREDRVLFDSLTNSLQVSAGSAAAGGYEVEAWGVAPSAVTVASAFVVGDFNGDGRDDLLISSTGVSHLAISDGSTFLIRSAALPANWNAIYAADFDGDGCDEILVGMLVAGSYAWSVADYRDAFGLPTPKNIASLNGFAPAFQQFFQDVNRDGRADLITRTSGSAPWMVRLAGVAADGSVSFTAAADYNAWINYGYNASTATLDADKAMAKVIEEFSWIYNNVELELYPGLMKGPTATEQTKAGNNWDQAALLEKKLQALNLGDVKIASGKVRITADQFGSLANWLGVSSTTTLPTQAAAVYNVLKNSLDVNVTAFDANGGSTTNASLISAIEFTHAWVQAYLPTASGMAWINLDPSWKFKDRQAGITLPAELDGVHMNLLTGVFDEFSYLALSPTKDYRLPIEFFEDQVMDWLAGNSQLQGNSLADVPYDGPIRAKRFKSLPAGFSDGMTLASTPGIVQYNDFNAIALDPTLSSQLTHRVTISLRKNDETAAHWTHDLIVPSHSLETIQITFGSSSATGVMTDPNSIATVGPYYSRLVINGSVVKWAAANESFAATDAVKIELQHLAPTKFAPPLNVNDPGYVPPTDPSYAGPTSYDRKIKFTEKPGDILAFGLEANQHSRDSLANLQAAVLVAVANKTTQADLIKDIDLLSSYAIAKYWHDYQRQNDAILGLMGAIGHQQWVGSGRIASKPSLLLDSTGGAGDVVIDYLAFGMAPVDFGIDLPNSNNGAMDAATGLFDSEAWQLLGYNSSALEHNIVEEITSAGSVSTIRGLQRASQQNLGVSVPGDSTPAVTDDVIAVFESRHGVGDSRDVYHVYNIRIGSTNGVQVISPAGGQLLNSTSFSNLLSSHNHSSATQIDDSLWAFLSNQQVNSVGPLDGVTDVVKAMATKHRTKVDSWTGSVYLTDIPGRSMQFAIQADGAGPINGGYSGGVPTPPPPELKPGTFVNASWAGDPVHVANGNMFRDETDIHFPNIGVPLTFSRHYDSQSKDDVGMGVGWTYSFSDMLYLDENGTAGTNDDEVVWAAASGARHRFKKLADGTLTTPSNLQGKLTRIATNEFVTDGYKYVYLDPSGMEYHFQELSDVHPNNGINGPHKTIGRLRIQCDEAGNGVQIDYTHPTIGHGFTQIRDIHNANRRLVFGYGTADRIVSIAKYDGGAVIGTWNYGYIDVTGVVDSEKRLASVTSPPVASVSSAGLETTASVAVAYDYYNNAAGDPAHAKGLIKKITEGDGAWHAYEYYRNGRTFRVSQAEAGVAPGSADVDVQTFNYNLVRTLTEFTDERGNVETYIHRSNGLLEKQIHSDRSSIKSTWGAPNEWNEQLMTSTTDERGAVEDFSYFNTIGVAATQFKHKQLLESTSKHYPNQAGVLTRYDYVQPNAATKPHLIAPSTITVDPLSTTADAANGEYIGQPLTTTNQYYASGDAIGRLWRTTDALGNVTEYAYYDNSATLHLRGLLRSIKQPPIVDVAGNPVQYETLFNYDAAGNVASTTTQNVAASPVIVAQETYVYDSNGSVSQKIVGAQVAAERVVTESVYDVLGRLRETGLADVNAVIDPTDGFASRFKYDKSGRVRESIDALGRSTKFEYDRQGNVVRQVNPDGTILLRAYDAFGNCIAVTDPLNRTTRFVYDSRNRLIQTIHPDGAVERLRYDGTGNVIATIDALGNATTFKYDGAGRLVETKLPDPDGPATTGGGPLTEPTTTNKYDKLGNLIETIDPEANVTQFRYDKLGRVVQSQTLKGVNGSRNVSTPWVVTGTLQSLTTTDYDAVGNVVESAAYDVSLYDPTTTSTLLADPRAQQTLANIAANKVQVVSRRYDALGRVFKTINADGADTSVTYDAAGRVRFQVDELDRVTEFRYDAFSRLEKTLLPDPATGAITAASPTTSHRYDAVGNRIVTIDPRGYATQFEYDAFNRQIAAVDANGNRSRAVYDVAGQPIASVDALGRAAYTVYDERGRVVQQRQADPDGSDPDVAPVVRNRYDAAGRLIETVDALGYSTLYSYDNIGRVTKESFVAAHDVVDSSSPSFLVIQGEPVPQSLPGDYGGSSKKLTPNLPNGAGNGVGRWDFTAIEPGTYRIYVYWSGMPSTAAGFTYRLSDWYNGSSGTPQDFFPVDVGPSWGTGQQTGSTGALRSEAEAWADWYELPETLTVDSHSSRLSVHLFAANGALQADAVRIERIATRSFAYNANGSLLTETDPLGRVTTYAYDELNRLVVETLPDPDGANNDDGGVNLISPQTTTVYDGYGNVRSLFERRGNNSTQRTTKYAYDSRNRRTEEIFDAGVDGATNYLNRRTVFDYDDVGNLERRLEYAEAAATPGAFNLLRTTSYEYDKLDRRTRETFNTDGDDNVTTVNERVTTTAYDASGNVTARVENVGTGASAAALTSAFRYDALNRVVQQSTSDALQTRISRYEYDAIGNEIAAIDPLGRLSRSEYDRLNRLVRSTDPDPDGKNPLASHATTFVYDAAGQLILKNNGANVVAGAHEINHYAYDPQGRLIYSQDGRGDVTRRAYDDNGNLIKLTDPAGNVTIYEYDKLNRKVSETIAAGTAAAKTRSYQYDLSGGLQYAVDRNGNVTKTAYTRDDQVSATWEYDTLANAQATTAPNTQAFIAFTFNYYDAFGRLEEERYTRRNGYNNTSGLDYRATDSYRYDGLDRIVEHSNQSIQATNPLHSSGPVTKQTYGYAYDSAGLVVTKRQFIAGQFAAETRSHFNAFGELARQVDVDIAFGGAPSTILDFEATDAVFSYWEDGSIKQSIRYTDWDGTILHSGHRNQIQTDYAYDGAGRLQQISYSQARRTAAINPWPANTPLAAFSFKYDAAGRIDFQGTDWNTLTTGLSSRTDETQAFAYDAAGQLLSADSNLMSGDASYRYNANGNRSSSSEPGSAADVYVTGLLNRVSQDSEYSYEYDDEGNLFFAYITNDPEYRVYYTWDDRNRLTKVSRFSGDHEVLIVNYRYNAAGELIYRKTDQPFGSGVEIEHYLVDSGERALTFEADGDVKRRYQYGPTGEVLFEQVFDAAGNPALQTEQDLLVPLGDHQHSTRVVLAHDANDAVYLRQSIDYAQFGSITAVLGSNGASDAGGVVTTFAHHGSFLDANTGLYLKGERWYSPDLGRFISEDPIQDGANWYMFAGNNPVSFADPSGLSLQGHPLGGGYSGNVTRAPTVPLGKPSTVLASRFPTTIEEFNKQLSLSSNLAALTEPLPLNHLVNSGAVHAELRKAIQRQARQQVSRPVFESPTASFFGSLWGDTKELTSTVAGGLWGVATNSEARTAFGEAWQRERVQPMADRLYSLSKAYGHTDEAIGDQNSFALFRATLGEILPINNTAQALEGRDLSTGQRTSDLQRKQDSLNAASGWLLFGAGVYSAGQQVRPQFSSKPGAGFVLGETSDIQYSFGALEEQVGTFHGQQTINRGYFPEAPTSASPPLTPKLTGPRPGAVQGNPANQIMETGVPLKNGVGWVKRWTRATPQEVDAQNRAIFEHYEKVEMQSRNLPPELQHNFRFEEMQRFRTQYREQFLRNRGR